MKEGKFAIYGGKEYSAEKNRDGKMLLRSTNISDVENGFEACKPFEFRNCKEKIVCLKIVSCSDIEDYYKVKTKVSYAGFMFDAIREKDDRFLIVAMTGDYREWLNLGMKCVDKGVYQKWVNKDEVKIEIVKEQLSY